MPKLEEDIQSRVIELATEAIEAFCEDIAGMFGVEIAAVVQPACSETVVGLQKRFKKLTAVNSVDAEGVLNGTFYVVYDQGGLFTLAGVVVMLPENRIKEVIRQGSKEEAQRMSDAIAELGNMMVGTWDRVFRETLRKRHRHFKQVSTFIGKPWDNPEDVLGVDADEEFLFIPTTMTVEGYPEFTCGVIFPSRVLAGPAQAGQPAEQDAGSGEGDESEPVDEPVMPEAEEFETHDTPQASDAVASAPAEASVEDEPDPSSDEGVDEPVESAQETQTLEGHSEIETAAETEAEAAQSQPAEGENESPGVEAVEEAAEPVDRPAADIPPEQTAFHVAEPEFQTGQPSLRISGEPAATVTAQQIMQRDIAWLAPDDTVQDAFNTMQQHETGYVMIGHGGVLEGIVSRSDVAGAVSPYLRPVFAKWKRPLDDATLQIKLSWIMTRPVRTITPQTALDVIVDTMLHFGGRCLPVVDQAGTVQGMV